MSKYPLERTGKRPGSYIKQAEDNLVRHVCIYNTSAGCPEFHVLGPRDFQYMAFRDMTSILQITQLRLEGVRRAFSGSHVAANFLARLLLSNSNRSLLRPWHT